MLEWREVSKLKSTYIDVLPTLVDGTGRIHTIFNQTATATGRLSSTNPNLQNIPVRSELGRRIRKAFVAPSRDRVLLAADYSQIELRLMAHLSGDAAMRAAFHEGQDIHDFTARQIFDVGPFAEVDPNQRTHGEVGQFRPALRDVGLRPRDAARDRPRDGAGDDAGLLRPLSRRARLHRQHRSKQAREKGYVETILGRRRYMPDLRARTTCCAPPPNAKRPTRRCKARPPT